MTELMLEVPGPNGVFGVFHEDEGSGYFFVYNPEKSEVLAQMRVYKSALSTRICPSDVQLMWSSDQTKCGIVVRGQMRGVIDIAKGRKVCVPLEDDRPGVIAPEFLRGFEGTYLDQYSFIKARQRYWKEMGNEHLPGLQPLLGNQTPSETNFIVYAVGHERAAVFEDDDDTGYLYLYSVGGQTVVRHLHIYDRSEKIAVNREDVEVLWSEDGTKCAVAIWGKLRGIIDVSRDREGRVWLEGRDTPGIGDTEWLKGFPAHVSS
jgi:hypothetical protein